MNKLLSTFLPTLLKRLLAESGHLAVEYRLQTQSRRRKSRVYPAVFKTRNIVDMSSRSDSEMELFRPPLERPLEQATLVLV